MGLSNGGVGPGSIKGLAQVQVDNKNLTHAH